MRSFFPLLTALAIFGMAAEGAEPFLKPHDVIALVGGEDMVAMSEYGYLELLLTRALPGHQLRFRNLACEGDTVFEQPRELNFPTLEQQLDKIGATVVIAQFGQMESLAGKGKLPEFISAYQKLIERLSSAGKRRVICVAPVRCAPSEEFLASPECARALEYSEATQNIAHDSSSRWVNLGLYWKATTSRDGFHLNARGHFRMAGDILKSTELAEAQEWHLGMNDTDSGVVRWVKPGATSEPASAESLRQLIAAKNRLWFHYWRPQNWAFLAGDRTTQPSSRDHVDPSKRWFPAEIEEFVPLIEAKEREIDALAAKLAQP